MKTITLQLPDSYNVPDPIFGFSPDEVGAVITIGVESVLSGRENILHLSETTMETRIRETYESRIQQLMIQITEQERQRKTDQESFIAQQTQFKDVFYKDNEMLREAVKLINGQFETEASGGVNESTIVGIAETGVDFISVGALTHAIKSLDLSLKAF